MIPHGFSWAAQLDLLGPLGAGLSAAWALASAALPLWASTQRDDPGGPVDPPADSPADPPVDHPDHDLVRKSLAGDPLAYRGLVERYQTRIYHVCYGMVRNREDARDLAQDAFLKAYTHLATFRFSSSFYTWLCRIATNVCIDHLRKQKLRAADEFEDNLTRPGGDGVVKLSFYRSDPSKELERQRLQKRIMDALADLAPNHRQVVILREIEGLSYKEIADICDIPEGTVMSRLFYARKRLQQALQDDKA
jgi:RNA polymerase sigma-70 factor (ECF subfamily)